MISRRKGLICVPDDSPHRWCACNWVKSVSSSMNGRYLPPTGVFEQPFATFNGNLKRISSNDSKYPSPPIVASLVNQMLDSIWGQSWCWRPALIKCVLQQGGEGLLDTHMVYRSAITPFPTRLPVDIKGFENARVCIRLADVLHVRSKYCTENAEHHDVVTYFRLDSYSESVWWSSGTVCLI